MRLSENELVGKIQKVLKSKPNKTCERHIISNNFKANSTNFTWSIFETLSQIKPFYFKCLLIIFLLCESMDWFLYDRDLCYERVKKATLNPSSIALTWSTYKNSLAPTLFASLCNTQKNIMKAFQRCS